MSLLRTLERNVLNLKVEASHAAAEVKFRKLMHAIKAGFDPSQPRDESGRWSDAGTSSADGETDAQPMLASYSNIEECNFQFKKDLIQCKFTGLRNCYAQAMVRLIACERGHPIPPLNY